MADDDGDAQPTASRLQADRARDGALVRAAAAGDQSAFGSLYDAWFDRVFALVLRITHDRDLAEEVSQDAFLSAWRNLAGLDDPASFGGWLLRIARNRAFDRTEREGRSRPVDAEGMAVIEDTSASPTSAPTGLDVGSRLSRAERPEVAAQDAEIAQLVREATGALSERDAEALDLQLRYDLTPAEIGEVMGLNRNAANQLCHRARARFAVAFGARTLWRGARPACPRLEAALATAGVTAYGPAAVTIADKHAADCDDCEERRRLRLQPTALFAAMPVVAAPLVLKAKVAGALAAQGVPMQGSAALTTGAAAGSGGTSGSGASGSAGPGPAPPAAPTPPPSAIGAPPDGPVGSAARIGGPGRPRRSRRVAVAAGVVAIVLVLLGAGVAVSARSSGSDDEELVVAEAPTSTTTVAPHPDASDVPPDGSPDAAPDGRDRPDRAEQPSTSTTQPTTTTAPDPPVVETLILDPATDKPPTWSMADAPVLTWSVTGSSDVEVWLWTDTGSGPVRTRLLSTEPSSSLPICPGTVTAGRCSSTSATYLFVVEAENEAARVVSADTVAAPRFIVYTVIN